MHGFYVSTTAFDSSQLFIATPLSKSNVSPLRPPHYYKNLLLTLCFGSCTSSGYRNPPERIEEPLPPRLYRRKRSSAIADSVG